MPKHSQVYQRVLSPEEAGPDRGSNRVAPSDGLKRGGIGGVWKQGGQLGSCCSHPGWGCGWASGWGPAGSGRDTEKIEDSGDILK